ncbi:MAG: hypothetical protein NVSMB56_19020 [Pyrinomonadaceae bacterium]
MSRKIFRHALDSIHKARVLTTSRELQRIRSYSMSDIRLLEELNTLAHDVIAQKVVGDFVECGVCNGGSAAAVACALRDTDRRLWLYDSFQGLPEPIECDGGLAREFVGKCLGAEENVREALRLSEFPEERYTIRKGWFHETFPLRPLPDAVAILHIDADWYDSVMLTLNTFYDLVPDGGVIILDDFGHWEGCREAFYDFVAERKIKPLLERFGHTQAFWVKNREHNRDHPASGA